MNDRGITFETADGVVRFFPLEKHQFSFAGELQKKRCTLEIRHAFYFRGEEPHAMSSPVEKKGPLFSFIRPVSATTAEEQGALPVLELAGVRLAATQIPFPAGVSFGTCHLGVREMLCNVARLEGAEFSWRARGTLEKLHDDAPGVGSLYDGATFDIDIAIAFQGFWLESRDLADEPKLLRLLEAMAGPFATRQEIDRFDNRVVIRASCEEG